MATVIENKKNGKTVSFKFRVHLGRNEIGKQINKYTTWFAPENLTPAKALKLAEKTAKEWEQTVKEEYEKDKSDPLRVKEREINTTCTPFADFINYIWFPIAICDGEHKHTTVEFYRSISRVSGSYFKDRALQKITSRDIQMHLHYLKTDYKSHKGTKLSPKSIRHQYSFLHSLFSFALKQEFITVNPMLNVDCPKLPKKKVDALTEHQYSIYCRAVKPYIDSQRVITQAESYQKFN